MLYCFDRGPITEKLNSLMWYVYRLVQYLIRKVTLWDFILTGQSSLSVIYFLASIEFVTFFEAILHR